MRNWSNCGVYRIWNTQIDKSYIGSAKDLEHRRKEHFRELQRGVHDNGKLQAAFNEYGPVAFEFEAIAFCPISDLLWHEQTAIDAFDAVNTGYNISPHAGAPMRGRKISEETRKKLSAAKKGVPKSIEHRRAIGNSHRGMKRSIKARQSMVVGQARIKELKRNREFKRNAVLFEQALNDYSLSPNRCQFCNKMLIPENREDIRRFREEKQKYCGLVCARKVQPGQKRSEGACQNMSNGWTLVARANASRYQKQTAACPHCGKDFNAGNLKQHLDSLVVGA